MGTNREDAYKYLGVHLNLKLDWPTNTTALCKKGQSRLYLRITLYSFGASVDVQKWWHQPMEWYAGGGSISTADRKSLDKSIRRAGFVLGHSAGGG